MKKQIIILLSLIIGFELGYFVKYRSDKNAGWDTFESAKWIPYEQGVQGENYRKKMVLDLVHNQLEFGDNGTKYAQLVKLIGKSSTIEDGKPYASFMLVEEIEEKYGWNIDPEGGTNLLLFFDKDSTLVHWRIEEFWHKP